MYSTIIKLLCLTLDNTYDNGFDGDSNQSP